MTTTTAPIHRHEASFRYAQVSGWSDAHGALRTRGTCACGLAVIRFEFEGHRARGPWFPADIVLGAEHGPHAPDTEDVARAMVAATSPHRVATTEDADLHISVLRLAARNAAPGQNSRPAILTLIRHRARLIRLAEVPVYTVPAHSVAVTDGPTFLGPHDPFEVDHAGRW